jgi:hypothetical protein
VPAQRQHRAGARQHRAGARQHRAGRKATSCRCKATSCRRKATIVPGARQTSCRAQGNIVPAQGNIVPAQSNNRAGRKANIVPGARQHRAGARQHRAGARQHRAVSRQYRAGGTPECSPALQRWEKAINPAKSRRDGPLVARLRLQPCGVHAPREIQSTSARPTRKGLVQLSLQDLNRFLCASPSAEALRYYRRPLQGSAEVNDWVTCTDE